MSKDYMHSLFLDTLKDQHAKPPIYIGLECAHAEGQKPKIYYYRLVSDLDSVHEGTKLYEKYKASQQ